MDENVAEVRDSVANSSAEGARPTERENKLLARKNYKKKKSKERFSLRRTIKDAAVKDVILESQVRAKASLDRTDLSIQENVASPPEDRSAQLTVDPQSTQVPNSCHGEYAGIPALKKVRQSCTIS